MVKNVLLDDVERRGNLVKYNGGFHSKMIEFLSLATEKYYSGSKCLVLGPSEGVELEFKLIKYFKSIVFVDGSSRVLNEVKRKVPGQEYIHCLFEEISLGDKFDIIIMHHILEHVTDPVGVLSKCKDLLNDGGKLILSVPNANSIHRMLGVEMGLLKNVYELNESDRRVGHKRVYDFASIKRDVENAKLRIIEKRGVFFKPLSNSQMGKLSQGQIDGFYQMGKDFPENCAEILFICSR